MEDILKIIKSNKIYSVIDMSSYSDSDILLLRNNMKHRYEKLAEKYKLTVPVDIDFENDNIDVIQHKYYDFSNAIDFLKKINTIIYKI